MFGNTNLKVDNNVFNSNNNITSFTEGRKGVFS